MFAEDDGLLGKKSCSKDCQNSLYAQISPVLFTCHLSWYGLDYFDTLALFCACRDNHECLSDFLALSQAYRDVG